MPSVIAVFSLLSPSVKVMSRPRRHLSNSQESADGGGEWEGDARNFRSPFNCALVWEKAKKSFEFHSSTLLCIFPTAPRRLLRLFLRTRNRDPDFPSLIATFTFFRISLLCFSLCIMLHPFFATHPSRSVYEYFYCVAVLAHLCTHTPLLSRPTGPIAGDRPYP